MSSSLLSPSSDLAQLLTSLGVSTSSYSPSSSSSSSSDGPDPLLVSRSRLASLKSSIEYGTEQLKQLSAITPLSSSPTHPVQQLVAIRATPPITRKLDTSKGKQPPPFVLIEGGEGGEIEVACQGVQSPAVNYIVYDSKQEAILAVRSIVTGLIDHFETLRKELVAEAKDRIQETMNAAAQSAATSTSSPLDSSVKDATTLVDEDGRVLNEEGLPFVDLNEAVPDDGPTSSLAAPSRSALPGFEPGQKLTGEERKRWIQSVFDRFGTEDDDDEVEDERDHEDEANKIQVASSASLRRQETSPIPSAGPIDTPAPSTPPLSRPTHSDATPLKSAMKPTPLPLKSRPSFGSTGIRRGFLCMNPSSPAAIASSDPLESFETEISKESQSDEGERRGRIPAGSSETETEEERMSRSEELPTTSTLGGKGLNGGMEQKKKKKKSVRIQSPGPSSSVKGGSASLGSRSEYAVARSSAQDSSSSNAAPGSSSNIRHEEEDTVSLEAEAARILSLLGPEVVQGTPAGDEAYRKIKLEEQERKAQLQAEEVRRIREERKKEADKDKEQRPAMGLQVLERQRGTPISAAVDKTKVEEKGGPHAKVSAFKRGFLSSRPPGDTARSPPVKEARSSSSASASVSTNGSSSSPTPPSLHPRTTLGMSALDRSLIKDAPLSAERVAKGLTPAVPHARPSKVYAEKLERKQLASENGKVASQSSHEAEAEADDVLDTGVVEGSRVRFKLAETERDLDGEGARRGEEKTASGSRQRQSELEEVEAEAEEIHHGATALELDDDDEAVGELDEHDEEAYARAAYASGDHSDDEEEMTSKLQRRYDLYVDEDDDDDDNDGEAQQDDDDEDWDGYNEDEYDDDDDDPASLVTDLESAELARSYALAKCQQMLARSQMSEERRKELERAISGELSKGGGNHDEFEAGGGGGGGGDLWTEEEIDGRDLSSVLDPGDAAERQGAGPNAKMSRFRASRIVKALGIGDSSVGKKVPLRPEAGIKAGASEEERRADEAGHELAHLLEGATNIGPHFHPESSGMSSSSRPQPVAHNRGEETEPQVPPVMILPSLTPLRFPRSTTSPSSSTNARTTAPTRFEPLVEGMPLPREGVDLQGETDEDERDEILLDVMRARLQEKKEREERRRSRGLPLSIAQEGEGKGEGEAAGKGEEGIEEKSTGPPAGAGSSLLLQRQRQRQRQLLDGEEENGGMGRESGKAMLAPPPIQTKSNKIDKTKIGESCHHDPTIEGMGRNNGRFEGLGLPSSGGGGGMEGNQDSSSGEGGGGGGLVVEGQAEAQAQAEIKMERTKDEAQAQKEEEEEEKERKPKKMSRFKAARLLAATHRES